MYRLNLLVGVMCGLFSIAATAAPVNNKYTPLQQNDLVDVNDATFSVMRNQLGSGFPAARITLGTVNSVYVNDGYWHVPQYMPNYPTASAIWPRVIDLNCREIPQSSGEVECDGYHWTPDMGRGEYLFIIPTVKKTPEPLVVLKEVPAKKLKE